MNKADAERIASVLEQLGYKKTESEDDANVIGVIACSVRQSAINRIYGKIKDWNAIKRKRPLITFASGCVLEEDRKKFDGLFDFLFEMKDLSRLPELMNQTGLTLPSSFWQVIPVYASTFQAYVPIQNGCDNFCTYCAVPYTRGREHSRPSDEVLEEVRSLIDAGYKRITLLGQNVNSYGQKTEGERSFAQLLEEIGKMEGDVWINYTSPNPQDMTEDVLEAQAKYSTIADLVHFPVQAGNDEVLKRMNRRYTVKQYLEWVERVRSYLPNVTLTTDTIVGFPGETEAQFQDTLNLFREVKFDMAYLARYSPRPGALSEQHFPDDVSDDTKKDREERLNEVLKVTALEKNESLVGTTIDLLVEKQGKNGWLGRTEGMKPVTFQSEEKDLVGKRVPVKIKKAGSFRLEG